MLYLTNFDDSDQLAIRKLFSIVSPFNVNLFCVHVSEKPENQVVQAKMSNLKHYFGKVNPAIKVQCSVIKGKEAVSTFKGFIDENHVNLVALTAHKRNLLYKLLNPSISKKMLYESDIPVLLFHA